MLIHSCETFGLLYSGSTFDRSTGYVSSSQSMAGRNHSRASLGGAYIPAPQHTSRFPTTSHIWRSGRAVDVQPPWTPITLEPSATMLSRSRASSLRTSSRQPSDTVEIEVASNNALSTRRVQLPDRRRSSTAGANTAVSERARFSYRAGDVAVVDVRVRVFTALALASAPRESTLSATKTTTAVASTTRARENEARDDDLPVHPLASSRFVSAIVASPRKRRDTSSPCTAQCGRTPRTSRSFADARRRRRPARAPRERAIADD